MTYIEIVDNYEKILVAYYDCISERTRKIISMQDFSEDINQILMLRADELIDDDDILRLLEHSKISDFLSEYRDSAADMDISPETRKKLFLLCLNSRYYSELHPVGFADVLNVNGKAHITITDDGYLICDAVLLKLMSLIELPCVIITREGEVKACRDDDWRGYVADSDTDYYIMPTDIMAAQAISELAGEAYIDDFIQYCNKNHIAADKRIKKEYTDYVQTVKLSFVVRLYRAYRHICGSAQNILDYRLQNGFTDEINLSIDHINSSSDAAIRDVQSKYLRNTPLRDNDVIELLNDRTIRHFVYHQSDDGYTFAEIVDFTKPLFDENRIWEIIRMYQGQIKTDGEKIYLPLDMAENLNENELNAAKNMLRQQQQSLSKQAAETSKQRLTAILDKARALKAQNEQEKEKKANERAAARAERKKNKPLDEDD